MTKSKGVTKSKGRKTNKLDGKDSDSSINKTDVIVSTRPTVIVNESDGVRETNVDNATRRQSSRTTESSTVIPRGRPKSGRVWKTTRTQSHNDMMRMNTLKTSWSKKMKIRMEAKAVKAREKELQEVRSKDLQMKHARRELNKKRREENQRKAEIVQPIKNTAKIKRMKKKELRMIAKR